MTAEIPLYHQFEIRLFGILAVINEQLYSKYTIVRHDEFQDEYHNLHSFPIRKSRRTQRIRAFKNGAEADKFS